MGNKGALDKCRLLAQHGLMPIPLQVLASRSGPCQAPLIERSCSTYNAVNRGLNEKRAPVEIPPAPAPLSPLQRRLVDILLRMQDIYELSGFNERQVGLAVDSQVQPGSEGGHFTGPPSLVHEPITKPYELLRDALRSRTTASARSCRNRRCPSSPHRSGPRC